MDDLGRSNCLNLTPSDKDHQSVVPKPKLHDVLDPAVRLVTWNICIVGILVISGMRAPLCPPRCCLVLIFVTCPKLRKLWDASAMTCHMVHMSCGETRGTGLPLMRSQCSMPATPVIPINIAGKSGSMYGTKSIFIASNRESKCADSFKRLWKVCPRKS